MTRVAIRGWTGQRLLFEDFQEVADDSADARELGEKHMAICKGEIPTLIEIEWLDEPNPYERFTRFGTDPARMVKPMRVIRPVALTETKQ